MNKILSALLLCLMVCVSASAATRTWTGNAGTSDWWTAGNWDGAVPGSGDDVIIPAGKTIYPVLAKQGTNAPTCRYIYFELYLMDGTATTKSARIGDQYLLQYEKAFYDLTIKANRYVRVASPLQNTFTGDYFVGHQTLDQRGRGDDHFTESAYLATVGNAASGATNRSINGTYYSFYNSQLKVANAYNTYDVDEFRDSWATPSNVLEIPVEKAYCFDVWVHNGATEQSSDAVKNEQVTFHFPNGDRAYSYFDVKGNLSLRDSANFDRSAAAGQGKFMLNEKSMKVQLTHKGTNSPMYAAGNPGFAYLQIKEFLAVNVAAKNLVPYLYAHNEELNSRGSEKIYYYLKEAEGGAQKLYCINDKYTSDGQETAVPTRPDPMPAVIPNSSREGYLNPAEGFRLMGGKTAYTCDEPRLVGIYSTGSFTYAKQVVDKYYDNGTRVTTYNTTGKDIPMLKNPTVEVSYSITTVPKHSNQVRINNFLGRGSVVATIIPSTTESGKGQLRIAAGTPIMNVMSSEGNDYNDCWVYDHVNGTDISKSGTLSGWRVVQGDNNINGGTGETPTTDSDGPRMTTAATSGGDQPSGNYTMNSRILKIYGITDQTSATDPSWSFRDDYAHSYAADNGEITAFNIANTNTRDVYLDYVINGNNVSINMTNKFFLASDAVRQEPDSRIVSGGTTSVAKADFSNNGSVSKAPITITTTNYNAGNSTAQVKKGGSLKISHVNGANITKVVLTGYNSNDYSARDWNASQGSGSSTNGNYTWQGSTSELTLSLRGNSTAYITRVEVTYDEVTVIVDNNPAFNRMNKSSRGTGTWDGYQCEAWLAYDSFVSSKTNTTAPAGKDFIMEDYNAEGAFTSWVRLNLANKTLHPAHGYYYQKGSSSAKYPIYISRVLGSYDVVSITGLYPGCYNAPVLGQIEHKNGAYYMKLPSGQLTHIAAEDGVPNPANDHYFYAHGNQADMRNNMVLKWNASKEMWVLDNKTGGNSCYEAMVAHQGIQPDANQSSYHTNFMDGLVLGIYDRNYVGMSSTANTFFLQYVEDASITEDETAEETPGDAGFLDLTYANQMFWANLPAASSAAPMRVAANNNAPLMIAAESNGMTASSMVVANASASQRYNRYEDAPIFNAADADFCIGTLAGSQLVAVNAVPQLDTLPLFISTSATLTFANVANFGDQVMLYDAVSETSVQIVDGEAYDLTVAEGDQAGRYFLIGISESPSTTTNVENVLSWMPVAYCPGSGMLTVGCAEELSYEVYAVNGMMVGAAKAQSYTFRGLETGTYVVRAYRGAEMQALKVIVY